MDDELFNVLKPAIEGLIVYCGKIEGRYIIMTDVPEMETQGIRVMQEVEFSLKMDSQNRFISSFSSKRRVGSVILQDFDIFLPNKIRLYSEYEIGFSSFSYEGFNVRRMPIKFVGMKDDGYQWVEQETSKEIDFYNPFGIDLSPYDDSTSS